MRYHLIFILLTLNQIYPTSIHAGSGGAWQITKAGKCLIHYRADDLPQMAEYEDFVLQGIESVESFWGESFRREFDLYIHPVRSSMDQAWQTAWNMPDFSSECWMVASGVAARMDLLSPAAWHREACEHNFEEKEETQKLIIHELIHVHHGQKNASPDFSEIEGIDWFVEGLATYASGQHDEERRRDVYQAVNDGKIPASLDGFWKGELRYGFCASMVQFIDQKYGRSGLKTLLAFSRKTEILQSLQTTELNLLRDWLSSLVQEGL